MKKDIRIMHEHRCYDGYLKIDEGCIEEVVDGEILATYDRYKVSRPDAVAVLLINQDTEKVTLIKQFRYPIAHRESENILEIVAGKIDVNETPEQAVCREVLEEVGYKISAENLIEVTSVYASSGYSTEMIHIFIATVTSEMKIAIGGGIATENESIEIIDMDVEEFMEKIGDGSIVDAKTLIAGQRLFFLSTKELLERGYNIKMK